MKFRWTLYRKIKIAWEKLNGLDFTSGLSLEELGFTENEANIYAASNNSNLVDVLDKLDIQSSDSILDFGAGKGVALVAMSKFKFKQVDGVELSQQLCETARKNLKKLGINNSTIFHSDAKEFVDIDTYSHFYFYNPFPGNILKVVLDNIKKSYDGNPRKITIIYYLPAFSKVIEEDGFFKEFGYFETRRYPTKVYVNEFDD